MRKRARRLLTGLLVACCAITGLLPVLHVQASSAGSGGQVGDFFTGVWSWITATGRSVGTFFSSVYASIRDFFASGQALKLLETGTQSIDDFAVRLFAPLAAIVLPLLQRIVPGLSATRELVAVWMFWIVVVLVLIVLILVLRPRRTVRRRLPKASPKTAGQAENSIEFGLVEQGPVPMPKTLSEQSVLHGQDATTLHEEPATTAGPVTPEQPSSIGAGSPSIPEISLEPLGFFGNEGVAPEAQPSPASTEPAVAATPPPPLLGVAEPTPVPEMLPPPLEPIPPVPVEVPLEALLETPEAESQAPEEPVQTPPEPLAEPDLTPIGQVTPPQATEAEPVSVETEPNVTPPAQTEVKTTAVAQEAQAAPSGADVLSRLLEEQGPAEALSPTPKPVVQPWLFAGDVDLDMLLQEGVVSDATALGQLFGGGYRNRISKLAMSAKDLQNVPEEIRNVVKLTVVALSPIELSIARDLAMRLEAPGFVGEALLVAKKMGYENYLTTYKNISRNYKDVNIVETVNLKAPQATGSESGDDLISFS
jgi:hypothetical protein